MTERPFFFRRDEARLFGMMHVPESACRKTAFLMSHPFAEEKLWSHRVFVSCARALVERGHIVLRFDCMGAGDSSGTAAQTSLDTHLRDLRAALQTLVASHGEVEQVGVIGLRLGATFGALLVEAAASEPSLSRLRDAPLVLWDPVTDGESYFQEILRSNLSTQLAVYGKVVHNREALLEQVRAGGTVNVDGYEIGKSLFESCALPALLAPSGKTHGGPVLVTQIASTEQARVREDLQQLAAAYRCGTFVRVTEQPFWREIKPFYGRAAHLQQATLTWLEQQNV